MHNIKDNNLVHLKRFLYEDFDEMVFERIKNKAFMHKLSHKPTKEQPSGKSFYDIITSV